MAKADAKLQDDYALRDSLMVTLQDMQAQLVATQTSLTEVQQRIGQNEDPDAAAAQMKQSIMAMSTKQLKLVMRRLVGGPVRGEMASSLEVLTRR